MSKAIIFCCIATVSFFGCKGSKIATEETTIETDYFRIEIDFWVNLHHYLYQRAKKAQQRHMIDFGEDEIDNKLSSSDLNILDQATEYYRAHLIDKDLLFGENMGKLRHWIQSLRQGKEVTGSYLGATYDAHLAKAANVYRKYYWTLHRNISREKFASVEANVRKLEKPIITRLEDLSQKTFPKSKIRIDLTVYSSGLAAYSSTRFNDIVISSADKRSSDKNLWMDIIFHEASHFLIGPRYPIGKRLKELAIEEGVKLPRSQWHVVLFYLAGKVVEEQFASIGIEHRMYMLANRVFYRRLTPAFVKGLDAYLAGEWSLDEALRYTIVGNQN